MRLPRDVSGDGMAKKLEKYGYRITRQTGSHLRLTTLSDGERHITNSVDKELRGGLFFRNANRSDHFSMFGI